jgi:putative membrane protein
MSYEWARAIHVMAWASWMAGLFYLPRLFVYHAERAAPGSESSEMLKVMERKLLTFIMRPAMIVTWITGLWLAFGLGVIDWSSDYWMHAKMLLVVAMTGAHYLMRGWMLTFAADANRRSGRFYRVANEAPTLLFVLIVIAVIVRPF